MIFYMICWILFPLIKHLIYGFPGSKTEMAAITRIGVMGDVELVFKLGGRGTKIEDTPSDTYQILA